MKGTLLREVPGTSVVHRLWAGTKLVSVAAISVSLLLQPSWSMLAAVAALLLICMTVARITPLALPRPPWWLWALVAFGGAINLVLGLDALATYGRGLLFTFVILWASITVAWTTPVAEVAPAVARLASPLRRLGAPVDEWAASLTLCLRALPLLVDEIYTLFAARRLRRNTFRNVDSLLVDALTAVVSTAIRRSTEMAEAIEVRGGSGRITRDRRRPEAADAAALVLVLGMCALGFLGASL
jgi:energy-coupling factor transport system permease protein